MPFSIYFGLAEHQKSVLHSIDSHCSGT